LGKQFGPFDSLIVEHMDADSIWEELACRNRPHTRFIQKQLAYLLESTQKQQQQRDSRGGKPAKLSKQKHAAEAAVTSDEDESANDSEMDEVDGEFDEDEDDEDDEFDEEGDGTGEDDDDEDAGEFDDDEFEASSGDEDEEDDIKADKFLDSLDEMEDRRLQREAELLKRPKRGGHKGAVEVSMALMNQYVDPFINN
jgi:hypothetical protein